MHSEEFKTDCLRWRGRVLTGRLAHWCDDWDGLPVDETTPHELSCCSCNFGGDFPPPAEVEAIRRRAARQAAWDMALMFWRMRVRDFWKALRARLSPTTPNPEGGEK